MYTTKRSTALFRIMDGLHHEDDVALIMQQGSPVLASPESTAQALLVIEAKPYPETYVAPALVPWENKGAILPAVADLVLA